MFRQGFSCPALLDFIERVQRAGGRFFNEGGEVLVRLMTPHRLRYEEAFAKAHPFDRLVEGMLSERMLGETVGIMRAAIAAGRHVTVIVNNRSGGNAPLVAELLAERFRAPDQSASTTDSR